MQGEVAEPGGDGFACGEAPRELFRRAVRSLPSASPSPNRGQLVVMVWTGEIGAAVGVAASLTSRSFRHVRFRRD